MTDPTAAAENPFAEIEAKLQAPSATGALASFVAPDSPLQRDGLRLGDIVVKVGETPVADMRAFCMAMQPQGEDDTRRTLELRRGDETVSLETAAGITGASFCSVRQGEPAWTPRPDHGDAPDFTGLTGGAEIWLRSSFGEEVAGFETLRVTPGDDGFELRHVMFLGGVHDGQTWDYCTRSLTTHRFDPCLSVTRTAFWQGLPEQETLIGDVRLGGDGRWRGVRTTGDGERQVDFPAVTPRVLTSYSVMLLPLTLPQREGASLTFCGAGDGVAVATCRERLECLGRREIEVAGARTEAWSYAWRHYGARPPDEDEHLHVSDDRRLLRVDWGPDYGGCWCEEMPRDTILATIPEHLRAPAQQAVGA